MRYHLFQRFFGKVVKIMETSLLLSKCLVSIAHHCKWGLEDSQSPSTVPPISPSTKDSSYIPGEIQCWENYLNHLIFKTASEKVKVLSKKSF